jgi:hypothetical protein
MLRGHVACHRGGRWRVLSAINAEAARLYGPFVSLGPSIYVTGHKPRGSSGSPRERRVLGKAYTRASTGPSLVLGSSPSRSLAKVRTLLGVARGPPEGPNMSSWELRTRKYRGPVFLCRGPDPTITTGIRGFAECCILCRVLFVGHSAKKALPSAALGKVRLSAKSPFTEC